MKRALLVLILCVLALGNGIDVGTGTFLLRDFGFQSGYIRYVFAAGICKSQIGTGHGICGHTHRGCRGSNLDRMDHCHIRYCLTVTAGSTDQGDRTRLEIIRPVTLGRGPDVSEGIGIGINIGITASGTGMGCVSSLGTGGCGDDFYVIVARCRIHHLLDDHPSAISASESFSQPILSAGSWHSGDRFEMVLMIRPFREECHILVDVAVRICQVELP